MSIAPMDNAAPTLPVITLQPTVKTKKKVPTNSATYFDTSECWCLKSQSCVMAAG